MAVHITLDAPGLAAAQTILRRESEIITGRMTRRAGILARQSVTRLAHATPRGEDRTDPQTGETLPHAADSWGATREGPGDYTIVNTAPQTAYLVTGTPPHIIRPRNGTTLAWQGEGGAAFAREVQHPGTTANPDLVAALDHEPSLLEQGFATFLDEETREIATLLELAGRPL
jgi:hypothetical protein